MRIETNQRLKKLERIILQYPRLLVAYSGGLDSAFLLKVAHHVLGEEVLGIIADSPSLPEKEKLNAIHVANQFQIPIKVIRTQEMQDNNYITNPKDRCYYCKAELFKEMRKIKDEIQFSYIAYGAVMDDEGDFRPGMLAAKRYDIKKPLIEAGLWKEEIRKLAKNLGLPNWNKPQQACLASRIPKGSTITVEKLKQVEKAEDYLHEMGFQQVRLRHFNQKARIEVLKDKVPRLLEPRNKEKVVEFIKGLGFKQVQIDLEGYQQGKLSKSVEREAHAISVALQGLCTK